MATTATRKQISAWFAQLFLKNFTEKEFDTYVSKSVLDFIHKVLAIIPKNVMETFTEAEQQEIKTVIEQPEKITKELEEKLNRTMLLDSIQDLIENNDILQEIKKIKSASEEEYLKEFPNEKQEQARRALKDMFAFLGKLESFFNACEQEERLDDAKITSIFTTTFPTRDSFSQGIAPVLLSIEFFAADLAPSIDQSLPLDISTETRRKIVHALFEELQDFLDNAIKEIFESIYT
ncbi:hypothetical protein GF342_04645 [Candidatus Woesearchaeota archaeon]|nr:hypothetical protein [Candidatus Woesearchaeota archaeon]